MKRLKALATRFSLGSGSLGMGAFVVFVAVCGFQIVFQAQTLSGSAEAIPYLTLDELSATLADERDVVLVEFCVPCGCSHCDQMRTSVDRFAAERGDLLEFHRVNLEQNLSLMWELNLTDCPSYVAFRDGEEVFRVAHPASTELITSGVGRVLHSSAADQLADSSL